jgi:hypothetical protein
VEDLRERWEEKGISPKTQNNLATSWAKSTLGVYGAPWVDYSDHCDAKGINKFDFENFQYHGYLDKLIEESENNSATQRDIRKWHEIISATIALGFGTKVQTHDDPIVERLVKKMGYSRPVKTRYTHTWDLTVAYIELFDTGFENADLKGKRAHALMAVKLDTGGRGHDIHQLYWEEGVKITRNGTRMRIRFWSPKGKPLQWSRWYSLYHTRVKEACAHCSLLAWMEAIEDFEIAKVRLPKVAKLQTPVWISVSPAPRGQNAGKHYQIAQQTSDKILKDTFNEFWGDEHGNTGIADEHGLHSIRHAHASALRTRGWTYAQIARQMDLSEQVVQSTYALSFDQLYEPVSDLPADANVSEQLRAGFYGWYLTKYQALYLELIDTVKMDSDEAAHFKVEEISNRKPASIICQFIMGSAEMFNVTG